MKIGPLLGDRFEIGQRIGTGGMGEVFRGLDRATGEQIAIKVIADGRDHRTARFVREVETLAELSHPGIVRYIAHGETAFGAPFFVMEWLDGEDLKVRLERAALSVGEAVTLVTRVAEALGAAHALGIVHRDLKPSNIFLPGGLVTDVKVIDFGIAQREGGTQLTQTGVLIGTPGYMAPEQARDHGVVDARADVFALGCVLYLCLTGIPAFYGDNAAAILGAIVFGEAPRVRELCPEVPEDLDSLIAQMFAKEPAQRPSNGAHLAAALAALGPHVHGSTLVPSERLGGERPAAITGSERRFLNVVLISRPADPALALEPSQALDADGLRRAIKPYGGRLEHLADGSTIVVLEADHQVATDQAAHAARCALAVRELAQGRPIAVAMGRSAAAGKLPESDAIDRACRLLALGPPPPEPGPPPIALDEVSAGLLDARFDVAESDIGLLLRSERPLAQGARTLLGRPTACVGRDWELGALASILDECIEEPEAHAMIVTAPAGLGKSRLASEFVARVRERPEHVAIWIGRGDSLRAGSTLDLLAQALRGALGIQGGEPLAERREKLRARIAARIPAPERQRITEFLGELVAAAVPDREDTSSQLRAARQDAQLMSEQMRRAFMDFLQAETAVHPVLLVLEDLHWGDFGTVRFIDTALRDRGELPWMVLALARPEVFEVFPKLWADRQNVQKIRLRELGRRAGERLVRQVLRDADTETIERIVEQADGNAFYLEELIRAVAEGKNTSKDGALPETVLAMVETRLARLPLEARRVLRAASVFGEVTWESGITLLLGSAMDSSLVGEWLSRLVEQEVLVVRPEGRFPAERELAFRHALLREGAYATLTDDDRSVGHRLAGEWLELHGELDAMVLASHFERGRDPARAAAYYLHAAEAAFHILDLDATMSRSALGLACAPPEELRTALLGLRCEASSYGLHLSAATMPAAEELMRTAPRGSSHWAQAVLAYLEGSLATGRIGDVLSALGQLRDIEPAPGAGGRVALLLLNGVAILDSFGQIAEGTALEARLREAVLHTGESEPTARFWWYIDLGFRASYAHGDPWSGLQHSDAIQEIFDVTGGERTYLNMQLFRGLNLWYLGAYEAAERILADIPAADVSLGVVSSLRRFGLAWVRADRGELESARTLAAQLAEYGHAHQLRLEEARGRWVLAEVLRRAGDMAGADRELALAIPMLVPLERPGALATLSALRLDQGRTAEALAAADEAASAVREMGGCGMSRAGFVRAAHAEALLAAGAPEAARVALDEARAALARVALRIPDPYYRRRFLEAVPEHARTFALAREWVDDEPPHRAE